MVESDKLKNPDEVTDRNMAMYVYILYCSSSVTVILGPIVGFLLALNQRSKSNTELGKKHFNKQVRIGWQALLGISIGIVTTILLAWLNLDHPYDSIVLVGIAIAVISLLGFFIRSLIGLINVIGRK